MANLIPFTFAINSVALLLIGAYIYTVDKKSARNSIWFVYNILFCVWNFCIYKALDSGVSLAALYWFRTSLAALIFMVPVFLHFLSIYSDREVFKKQILGKVYIISLLFFTASFVLPGEFIKGIAEGRYFRYITVPGFAFNIFTFVCAGFIFCGFYYLLHSAKLYMGFKRNQRMWIFAGTILGMMAPLGFFLAVYKITFFPFGIFFIIPYLAIVSYTILKHHVYEMDVVINQTVILSYFTLFVLLIHMFIVHVLHRMVGVDYFTASIISGGVVLVNLLFTAHYAGLLKLSKITDRIVYEKKVKYYKFLENFSSIADEITDLGEISHYILDSLADTVGIKSATLYLYEEDAAEFELFASRGVDTESLGGIKKISIASPFVNFLRNENIYVASESGDFSEDYNLEEIKKSFDKINVRLTIPLYYSLPLYHKRDMVGFLNLGDKTDSTPYTKEDIDIVNAFGRQLSTCIDNAQLYSRAIMDDLTKLYRIGYLNRRIQEEMARFSRYHRPFSFMLMDIDDFKKVNDTFGHQVGDEVLKKIGYLIRANVRKVDIAARYGGEEFGVLMPETTKPKAYVAAERLRKHIEEAFRRDEKRFSITISIGVSDYRAGMEKYRLIREADEALYGAKRAGKNRVC
ncbi:MAG: diguanylate cyclase [Candidatus Omnitrophota bacterium]